MEAVIFVGLPGSGKSSFFKERQFSTHVRVSLDLLKTRFREQRLIEFCLSTEQRFAIDNTNPEKRDRAGYIAAARAARFRVTGFYFQSKVDDCLARNAQRPPDERVPEVAVLSCAKKLQHPSRDEGFDELYFVRLVEEVFVIEAWRDDV